MPAVSYELRSERDERTEVTLVERLPATVDPDRVGYHPGYGGDGRSCYDGGELVWRGELGPHGSRRLVLATWLDPPDSTLSLLTLPTVEAVRTVRRDAGPHVLDETLLAAAGSHSETDAVAEHVPDAALRDGDATVPAFSDLPDPGEGLAAPARAAVEEVVDAVVGGGAARTHDRYYHLRLAVETAERGGRGVSLLEDLTNALSVLFADADDRDGGDWRVLDVGIGTNWRAERIVTALGDDRRVSGLVVTELTGAVAERVAVEDRPSPDPNPDEFAAAVFEAASTSSATDADDDGFGIPAELDGDAGPFEFDDADATGMAFDVEGEDGGSKAASADPVPEPTGAMETFAALRSETERADVAELDQELSDVVLSPTGEEEYSIEGLLDGIEDDAEPSSV